MRDLIFDIQRFCVYDGPGIRTTVFFKGCNMHCAWCHNPESFSTDAELLFRHEKCTPCGACTAVCPNGAHEIKADGTHVFDRAKCAACGKCAEVCPNDVLELSGREMTVEAVMKQIDKDAKYYRSSKGGVTFSGGEASLHFELLKKLLTACREKGYHTALETNGLISAAHLKELIPLTDLFLFDFKHSDPDALKKWASAPLAPILESLAALEACACVVALPGHSGRERHGRALCEAICALKHQYTCIEKAEIMAYHDIGKTKWDALGIPYSLAALKTVSPEQKHIWETKIAD